MAIGTTKEHRSHSQLQCPLARLATELSLSVLVSNRLKPMRGIKNKARGHWPSTPAPVHAPLSNLHRSSLCSRPFPLQMDAGAYSRSYTSLLTESSSGHSADDNVIGSSSDMDLPPPQEPFLEDEGPEINHWLQGSPLNARDPRVNAEARFIVSYDTCTSNQLTTTDLQPYLSDRYPSVRPTLVRGIDGRLGTPHLESLIDSIHEENLLVTRPSDSMHSATALPRLTQV